MAEMNISEILRFCSAEITKFTKSYNIDAVVNAAHPTLMGSVNPSVDHSIHTYINSHSTDGRLFKDKIREVIDNNMNQSENRIRCERGRAVVTSGESLCKYVIHVVGPIYDGKKGACINACSSSRIEVLESCYYEIVNEIKKHPDIETVAIPIISAGSYKFPIDLAVKVAIASVGNALVDWKNKDEELFKLAKLKRIYFCFYDPNNVYDLSKVDNLLKKYNKYFLKNKKVVHQNSIISHIRYFMEIWRYDNLRGYFAVAKLFRVILVLSRFLFLPFTFMKDICGGCSWQRRRATVEVITITKVIVAVILFGALSKGKLAASYHTGCLIFSWYSMLDTVTYLVLLIVMADIQRPSANVIRSIMLLLVNYIQVSFDIANIYMIKNYGANGANNIVSYQDALAFGMMGELPEHFVETFGNICLAYFNTGLKFFFMTLAFGYFANNLKARRYLS